MLLSTFCLFMLVFTIYLYTVLFVYNLYNSSKKIPFYQEEGFKLISLVCLHLVLNFRALLHHTTICSSLIISHSSIIAPLPTSLLPTSPTPNSTYLHPSFIKTYSVSWLLTFKVLLKRILVFEKM